MKKVFAALSCFFAIAGTIALVLAIWFIDNYILGWSGVLILIIGIIGVILFENEKIELLWKLLDFL